MDEDEGNALEEFSAELEQHLYSKIHHGQVESVMKTDSPPSAPGGSYRGRNGRYFAQGGGSGRPFMKKFAKKSAPILGIDKEAQPESRRTATKFTPYQSFLQGIMGSEFAKNSNLRKNPAKLFRKPPAPAEAAPAPAESKREKKKNRRKEKKKPETIVLDSSEDEKDDDVVEVPVPPPPLVCLDSSDESQQEGLKKNPKKDQPKHARGSSPSSSILSDDFIAAKDRKRLVESQSMETVHMADEELRTVQQQSKPSGNPQKRPRVEDSESAEASKEHFSDISTSDSEDFLPDQESSPKHHYRKRKRLPPSPKETPYILKGEALPNAVTVPKRKSIDLSTAHRSDEEFITILSSIANGDTSNSQNPGNSDDDPVEIVSEIPGDETTDILLNVSTQDNQKSDEEIEIEKKSQAEDSEQDEDEEQSSKGEEEEEVQAEESVRANEEIEEDNLPRLTHGWNMESRRFYEDSWGGENFSVKKVLEEMPANSQWQISSRDFNFSRFHRTWREPHEMKLVCYMCGESGHREPRCPNTLCLRCGSRSMVFGIACGKCSDWPSRICEICQTAGHKKELCPDTWRRYHSTVEGIVPVEVKECLNDRIYCSMCAKKGHTADSCTYSVRILEYPVSPWKVSSYEAVYESSGNVDNPKDPFYMYRGERMKFAWSESVQKSQFYQRFLKNSNLQTINEKSPKEEIARVEIAKEESAKEKESYDVEEATRIQTDNAESKIFLHKDYCNRLLSPRGKQVLMSLADDLTVEVNLRSSQSGNLLKLRGERENMESFKQTLMRVLGTMDKSPIPSGDGQTDEVQNIPKNRLKMIRFLRGKMQQLLSYIGDVTALYVEMADMEKKRMSVKMRRKVENLRIKLNMILVGQAGLVDGKTHLRVLEQHVMNLEQKQAMDVPLGIRNNIFLHFKYIFTPFRHDKYQKLIKQFHKLRRDNKLPQHAISRQFIKGSPGRTKKQK